MKKLGIAICILMGAALCCAWVYVKADTLQRETHMITKIFIGG